MPARSPAVDGRTRQRRSSVGDATRQRLMRAAVTLVARKGYDAVSIRDITNAARTDVTAVHYHFGSKRGLVAATLQQFLDEVGAARAPLLEALRTDPEPSPRDIARCLVVPAAQRLTGSARGRNQNAFVAAVVHHAEFSTILEDAIEPDITLYMEALQRSLPRVPAGVLIARLLYSIGAAQRELSQTPPGAPRWQQRYGGHIPLDPIETLIDYIAGGLCGN